MKQKAVPDQSSMYSGILDDKDPVGRDERLQNKLEHIAKVTAEEPDFMSQVLQHRAERMQRKAERYAKLSAQIC